MNSYFKNIQNRAKWLTQTNKLATYDPEMVFIYRYHFGHDYNKHFSTYMDKNKICAKYTHFEQIIDFLVLYYNTNNISAISVYNDDIALFMGELSDMGYYFTDSDALYCIQYGFFLPHFKIVDKNKSPYKELKNIIYNCFETESIYAIFGCKIPYNYLLNFDDPLLESYDMVYRCVNITSMKSIFDRLHVVPNITHAHIINMRRINSTFRKSITTFFKKYNIKLSFNGPCMYIVS